MDGCGISCWHPNWLQKFSNTRWFMIIYGLLGTVQATCYLYFVVTLTTIEKRFKIPSQTTGTMKIKCEQLKPNSFVCKKKLKLIFIKSNPLSITTENFAYQNMSFYLLLQTEFIVHFTGIILSGNEISQILLSLILSYVGGQRNRPRWIACGVVFSACSCFILAFPHFIYGAGDEALQYTHEYVYTSKYKVK